jgi:hypothetical protein
MVAAALLLTVTDIALIAMVIRSDASGHLLRVALQGMLSPALAWGAVVALVCNRRAGPAWAWAILPGAIVLAHGFVNAGRLAVAG